eukprot:357286-Chlamydomonas_euryale.AAC.3
MGGGQLVEQYPRVLGAVLANISHPSAEIHKVQEGGGRDGTGIARGRWQSSARTCWARCPPASATRARRFTRYKRKGGDGTGIARGRWQSSARACWARCPPASATRRAGPLALHTLSSPSHQARCSQCVSMAGAVVRPDAVKDSRANACFCTRTRTGGRDHPGLFN